MNKKFLDAFKRFAKKTQISYNDINIFIVAFTHTSYSNEHKVESNERLEFIGDAILDFLVGEYLYKTYPEMDEGEMSKTRAIYVCEEANASYARKLELNKLLMLGNGEEEQGGRNRTAILADLFEAFLGALYLDGNDLSKVREILDIVVFPNITFQKTYYTDYKSTLQEYIQSEVRNSVVYVLEKEEGPAHDKMFTIGVYLENVKLGEGVAKRKQEAEQIAAKVALTKLAK